MEDGNGKGRPMRCLHVTNGDLAAGKIEAVAAPGEPVLPWRDILHEGPVRGGLGLGALSLERGRYLARRFGLEEAATVRELMGRDACLLEAIAAGAEIALWFEHDLYDQLQLLQVLALLEEAGVPGERVRLAQAEENLSLVPAAALRALGAAAEPVTGAQLALAREAWAAFRAPTPEGLVRLLAGATGSLPKLGASLLRLLEELPMGEAGLSRTERQILEGLRAGAATPGELFRHMREQEEAPFLGDWPFFAVLDELAAGPTPLVEGVPAGGFPYEGGEAVRRAYLDADLRLSEAGRRCLAGRLDRTRAVPFERWLGGTQLTRERPWRWDPRRRQLGRW